MERDWVSFWFTVSAVFLVIAAVCQVVTIIEVMR